MDSERLKRLRQDPPARAGAGVIALLLEAIRAFLLRLFGGKHPGRFDAEFGSWEYPDFNLFPGASHPAPRPLASRDCDSAFLVYTLASIHVERCTLGGQFTALNMAIDQIAQYQRDHFRCEAPKCPREVGDIVWIGLKCGNLDGPHDEAGLLVRLKCEPER